MDNERQRTDTKNSNVENFSVDPDGMSLVATRILKLAQNSELSAEDRLDMIKDYCILIIRMQPT